MIRLWHRCGTSVHVEQSQHTALFSDATTDDALTNCPGCRTDLHQALAAGEFTCMPPAPRLRRYLGHGMRTAA